MFKCIDLIIKKWGGSIFGRKKEMVVEEHVIQMFGLKNN